MIGPCTFLGGLTEQSRGRRDYAAIIREWDYSAIMRERDTKTIMREEGYSAIMRGGLNGSVNEYYGVRGAAAMLLLWRRRTLRHMFLVLCCLACGG